jgi:choline dehydrogenase-like flavoprotein
MRTHTSDVVIVGSGFGGAAPALRLSRAGASVTIVEKGPRLRAAGDFRLTQDPQYVTRYLKNVPGDHLDVTCAEALGGASAFYEMVSLRAPSAVFDQVDQQGRRLWPEGIDRSALDPGYDTAERMLEVEQIPLDEVPKTGLVFSLMMNRLGYSCDRARYAVRGCIGSGYCVTGCVFGAKRWLLMNYLPQAVTAGAKIETDMEAIEIRPLLDPGTPPSDGPLSAIPLRYELVCRDRNDGSAVQFRSRILILAGGTVGTAALLLESKPHLPYLSYHVGRNIAFNGSVKAAGLLPDDLPEGDMFTGRSHPGVISYEFFDTHGITVFPVKPLPLQLTAGARLLLDGDDREHTHWGEANVEIMKVARRRLIILDALGLTPPAASLDLVDGKPELRLVLTPGLRSYHARTEALLRSILSRNGCRLLNATFVDRSGDPRDDLHFSTAHQVGSCRMADSKETGVVDKGGEVFDYPGLYVTDGSAVPTSLAVNTSLTILANAERIAAGIVRRHAARAQAAVR